MERIENRRDEANGGIVRPASARGHDARVNRIGMRALARLAGAAGLRRGEPEVAVGAVGEGVDHAASPPSISFAGTRRAVQ